MFFYTSPLRTEQADGTRPLIGWQMNVNVNVNAPPDESDNDPFAPNDRFSDVARVASRLFLLVDRAARAGRRGGLDASRVTGDRCDAQR